MDLAKKTIFFNELKAMVNELELYTTDSQIEQFSKNTLNVKKSIVGIVFPKNIEELKVILFLASKFSISIYPVSQGKNIGYGNMTPTSENQLIVNLRNLNSIREFDSVNGEVVVEPGVTQGQLAKFLLDNQARYWADVTGASPDASVLGNSLEAGFGHTPLGDHRKNILNMEILLANGTIFSTGEMPSVGPDLAQLFVQSNFGVILSIRIPLFRIPENTLVFTLRFNSDFEFAKGIEIIRELKQIGVITNLIHSGNATRALMSCGCFPDQLNRSLVLDDNFCVKYLNKNSIFKFSLWTSMGAIYGSKAEINEKKKKIKNYLKGVAKVNFYSDFKMNLVDKILGTSIISKIRGFNLIRESFKSFLALRGLLKGIPTSTPSNSIYWRVNNDSQLGIAWHAPVILANSDNVLNLLKRVRPIFNKFGFEMPLTITFTTNKHLTAIFNINFNKQDSENVSRAHELYKVLSKATESMGYKPYRIGLLTETNNLYSKIKLEVLNKIKNTLDPKNIIAPGRYGIGSEQDQASLVFDVDKEESSISL